MSFLLGARDRQRGGRSAGRSGESRHGEALALTERLLPMAAAAEYDLDLVVNGKDGETTTTSSGYARGQEHSPAPGAERAARKRFLPRTAPGSSAQGRINLQRHGSQLAYIQLIGDWFHHLASLRTATLIFVVFWAYVLVALLWAGFFYAASGPCHLEMDRYLDAFYLSIETLSTIGYGIPDQYFGGCYVGTVILTTEYLISILLDSLCIGLVFIRLSRPDNRRHTAIFSNKAVVQRIRGQLHFMFQVCDVSKLHLLEAHVRCYAIRHMRRPGGGMTYFQSHAMRLQHPDDELGAMLLMPLPSIVVHRIDAWSPLALPGVAQHAAQGGPSNGYLFPDVLQRANDAEVGGRESRGDAGGGALPEMAREDVTAFWQETRLEILCLVEGIDELTGCTLQTRFSYTPEELEWDHEFKACVSQGADGTCHLDLDVFHQTQPVGSTGDPGYSNTLASHS